MNEIIFGVHDAPRTLAVDPRMSLLDLLRERLGPAGPKKGCDHGSAAHAPC